MLSIFYVVLFCLKKNIVIPICLIMPLIYILLIKSTATDLSLIGVDMQKKIHQYLDFF